MSICEMCSQAVLSGSSPGSAILDHDMRAHAEAEQDAHYIELRKRYPNGCTSVGGRPMTHAEMAARGMRGAS